LNYPQKNNNFPLGDVTTSSLVVDLKNVAVTTKKMIDIHPLTWMIAILIVAIWRGINTLF
jgi:hypothetical protein